ncbi:MAG TPA: DUF1361 domain-containing protein [Candidatus Saccharimonadales bacterium]|nr:DUF1361 domain-containing protein [Candidatus Saccharimonadales bacterium]
MNRWRRLSTSKRLGVALGAASLVSAGFWAVGAVSQHRLYEWYLNWNLFLAWLPLLFAVLLVRMLARKPWSSWEGLGLTFLWLVFLPNSFYMVSDFIHLREVPESAVLYDAVMFASFIFCGATVGFLSLFLVHEQLRKRLPRRQTIATLAVILLICSFAIYLGRNLRWNSWDLLLNPAGVLFDISDRVLNPLAHVQTFTITFSFFVLLTTFYALVWQIIYALSHRRPSRDDLV